MLVTHDQMASLPIYGMSLWNQWTDFHGRLCVARGGGGLFRYIFFSNYDPGMTLT